MTQPVEMRDIIVNAIEASLVVLGPNYGLSLAELNAACNAMGRGPGMVPATLEQLFGTDAIARHGDRFVLGNNAVATQFMFSFEDDYRNPEALDFPFDHLWRLQEQRGPDGAADTWANILAAGVDAGIPSRDLEIAQTLLMASFWIEQVGDKVRRSNRIAPSARPSKLLKATPHRMARPLYKQVVPIVQQIIVERGQHETLRRLTRESTLETPMAKTATTDSEPPELREFLESSPLYGKGISVSAPGRDFYPTAMQRNCKDCKAVTSWTRAEKGFAQFGGGDLLEFACAICRNARFVVWILADTAQRDFPPGYPIPTRRTYHLRKIGQWEPWSIAPNRALEDALGEENAGLYRHALMNLSTSYGIGALAYFRRVIENEVDRVLEVLAETAKLEGDEASAEAIQRARSKTQAEEKLRLAADAAPPSLKRLGTGNPLSTLYGEFSAGIHGKSDAECCDIAKRLRAAFEYIFQTLRARLEEEAKLRRALSGGAQA